MKAPRNTLQRELVLSTVRALHNHPTAEDIYNRIVAQHPSISRATVYRNLNLLAEKGDIKRVSHLNAADRFDYQTHQHYHFRCTACDSVFDVEMPYDDTVLQRAQMPEGFRLEGYELTFTGTCKHCAKNQGGPS